MQPGHYVTVIVPLIAAALIVRKALGESTDERPQRRDPESELFTPYGP
jgi:hypothetical protein